MTKTGAPEVLNSRPAAQTVGRAAAARAVAHAARARRRGDDGGDARHRHRRHPPLASHRVPRRVPAFAPPSADSSRSSKAPIRLVAAVVPHGGLTPIITPNPIAAGLPTSGDPILIDISMSITSMGFANQEMQRRQEAARAVAHRRRGQRDRRSRARCSREPKGALLPLGGLDAGYKGFGLALLVEALTAGLAGLGRADPPEGWGGTVFVQVLDPEAFGGSGRVQAADGSSWCDAAHASKPRPGVDRVRLPGEAGMKRRREQQRERRRALSDDHAGARCRGRQKLGVAPPLPARLTSLKRRVSPSRALQAGARPATTRGMPARSRAATMSAKPARREQRAHRAPTDRSRARRRACRPARDARARRRRCARIAARPSPPGVSADARLEAHVALAQDADPRRDVRRIAGDQVERAVVARQAVVPVRLARTRRWRCPGAARCRAPSRARRPTRRSREPRARPLVREASAIAPEPVPRSSTRDDRDRPAAARARARPASRSPAAGSAPRATRASGSPQNSRTPVR